MNVYSAFWRLIMILLGLSIQPGPLPPAGCQRLIGCGNLTVDPAPLFCLGSNLTVYCHNTKCPRSKISLELNLENVNPWKIVNSTTVMFRLFNVRVPLSIVRCYLQTDIVGVLELHGGLPPDKPENIICETWRSSAFIDCSWERGQETHLRSVYTISVYSENGTLILSNQTHGAEKITLPRVMMDEDTKYQLNITAYNHFGTVHSDPVTLWLKEIVIPETPHVTLKFNSKAALLQWETDELSEHFRSYVRLRTYNATWSTAEVTELSEDLMQVDGLKPLTEYEFQMRTCNSTSGGTHTHTLRSARSNRSCSKWSPSVRGRSPGKGPSQQLHVWRKLGSQSTSGFRMVAVLWKPPSPEDYSGEVQQYNIFLDSDLIPEMTSGAAVNMCLVQVPADVHTLSISAVTSYGASPPVDVPLRHSGDIGPVLRELTPTANASAVLVSWYWPETKQSTRGGELLHYVLEWTGEPETELQWKQLFQDENSTLISGVTAGVRYNLSLYAVTSRGVSAPSSGLVYSKEQKPVSGPSVSVLVHEARRIQIQWDELPVNQQRGFITNYTIYIQTLDPSNTEVNVTVPGSDPRQKWLNCLEGALALQVTASTSAGEGPRGNRISFQPATHAAGPAIVVVLLVILFIAIVANLMRWRCVRKRVKQKCISWRPSWFDENLPKLSNSIAIRLLEHDGGESIFSSTYSDPPLSPISLISQEERNDMYPNVHIEISQVRSGQPTAEIPLLITDPETMLDESQLEQGGYKPQIPMRAPHGEEVMETEDEQRDMLTSGDEDGSSSVFEGFPGGFLSRVEVDISDSPLGLTVGSVRGPLWPKTSETTGVLTGDYLHGGTGNDVVDAPSHAGQQGEKTPCDAADTCFSPWGAETAANGGYFPQVAAVSGAAHCDPRSSQGRWE